MCMICSVYIILPVVLPVNTSMTPGVQSTEYGFTLILLEKLKTTV